MNPIYASPPPQRHHHPLPLPRRRDVRRHLAGADPVHAVLQRPRRAQPAGLHREHPAAGIDRRRPAQRHRRLDHHDRDRRRHRRAARPVRRHLSRRIRQARQAHLGDPLHQRHPAQRALDHHRPVHLWRRRGADGRLLGARRLPGARGDRDPRRGPHHRGHAAAGAQSAARGGVRARPAALAGDQADRLSRRARRPHHRRAAGDRARRRRNRAAAVHRALATSSSASISPRRWPTCR